MSSLRDLHKDLDRIAAQLEQAQQFAEYPLRNELEVGFRHSQLTDKEKLLRYEQACAFIAEDIKFALDYIDELTFI